MCGIEKWFVLHFSTNHFVHKNLTIYFLSRSIFIIVSGQKRGSKPVRFSSSPHHTSEGREDIFFLCSKIWTRKKPGNRMVPGFFGAISFLVAQCGCGDRTWTCDLRVMRNLRFVHYSAVLLGLVVLRTMERNGFCPMCTKECHTVMNRPNSFWGQFWGQICKTNSDLRRSNKCAALVPLRKVDTHITGFTQVKSPTN